MFVVHENARPLPIHAMISTDQLDAQMKSGLVFKPDRDSPGEGKANFHGDLVQPVFKVLFGGFPLREPAIQPRRAGDRNPFW
jgi:hypothetical protein